MPNYEFESGFNWDKWAKNLSNMVPHSVIRNKSKKHINKKRISQRELAKKIAGNKCIICGHNEEEVGRLQSSHILTQALGGRYTIWMCGNHHTKFDDGVLKDDELNRLNLSREEYNWLIKSLKRARRRRNKTVSF